VGYGILIPEIEIISAQILVGALPLPKIVGNDQHRTGHSNNRPLFALPHDQTMVLGGQIGTLRAWGSPRRLAQGSAQPDASLAWRPNE